jgi:hypothetical protein
MTTREDIVVQLKAARDRIDKAIAALSPIGSEPTNAKRHALPGLSDAATEKRKKQHKRISKAWGLKH